MENIKDKIEEIVNKVKNDKSFGKKFKENPVSAVESVIGIDLPEDKIDDIVKAVKTKINLDDNKIVDKIKGFFD